MLQIPLWNRLFIVLTVLVGLSFAMPNFFYGTVERHNDALAEIERTGVETPEQTQDIAAWPSYLPATLVNLGLDLRGGAHLLAEVRVEDVYVQRMDSLWPEVRETLQEMQAITGGIRRIDAEPGQLQIRVNNPEALSDAVAAVRELGQPVVSLTGGFGESTLDVSGSGDIITVQLSEAEQAATNDRTLQQSIEIVRRRVDEAGTREPTIQRQGSDRILIQVPGIGSAQELKELIGTTARLTFHPVVGRASGPDEDTESRQMVLPAVEEGGGYYILEETPVVSGDDLVDSQPGFDQQTGEAIVTFRFNPSGARAFGEYTAANVGAPFAIVLDEEVISAPVIRSAITGGAGQISGNFTVEGSTELAILLRAGALPAEMTFLEERTIGPELGADSVAAGETAAMIAFAAVLIFMIASYGLFGVFASIALVLNVGLIFGVLSLIGATLTLPGIAGIVLTIGMAVDANVLVFERIREELKTAKGPARAIELGYERALSAIVDANITTFIIATILFVLGSGPVRGFSVTLGIGIVTSVFTAIYVTRLLLVFWFERKRPKTIEV